MLLRPKELTASSSGSSRSTSGARSCPCSRRWPSTPAIPSRISATARCAWWPRSGPRRRRRCPTARWRWSTSRARCCRGSSRCPAPTAATSSSCWRTSSGCSCRASTTATTSCPATRSGSPATPICRSRGRPEDLLASIEAGLRERRLGAAVRLQYDADLPAEILATLRGGAGAAARGPLRGRGLHGLLRPAPALRGGRRAPPQGPAAARRSRSPRSRPPRHLERDPRPRRARPPPVPRLRRGHPLRARGGGRSRRCWPSR